MVRTLSIRTAALLVLLVLPLAHAGCGGDAEESGYPGGAPPSGAGRVEAADPADPAVALADSLVPRLEVLAGLPARGPLRLARRSRADLRRFVADRLEEEMPPERAGSLRDLYALLGVLPDTLDLRRLLLDLYTEQVAGYYDPQVDTLFLVQGMAAEQLDGILAHELVHALQDQHAPLDSLIHRDRGNDRQTAAQAALEGHATMVMLALSAERLTGRALDAARLPDPATELAGALAAQNAAFPVFAGAPPFIQRTLLFPYLQGASFVRHLWQAAGAEGAWPAPLGADLPVSTEQVLHPAEAFTAGRDTPTELGVTMPGGSWRVRYEGTLGQFETMLVLEESGTEGGAVGWDGDRVLLLEDAGGSTALLWLSVWDDVAAADRFAAAAERVAAARADRVGVVARFEVEARPAVRVMLAPAGVALEGVPLPATIRLHTGAETGNP
ncbi:MAG: hypothetical protein WEB88_10480 [Gemmatimonadota bacterium]